MITKILEIVVFILSFILLFNSLYHLYVGLHIFKKSIDIKPTNNMRKFALLIAARNEENVIGDLIESLKNVDYPSDKYEIIVAPNNCTDNTKNVAKKAGARIFEVNGVIKSKGDVLHQMFEYLIENEDHDAYMIFDADNLVDKNFIKEMNKMLENGFSAIQGYRDTKNPDESATAGATALYHYMMNTFYNSPRYKLGINNALVGCGFVVTKDIIKKLGGWNTKTITEDLEFTVLTTLKDEKIGYCKDAIFYDEQPNSFSNSWHQRIRWSAGSKEGFLLNIKKAFKKLTTEKNLQFLDIVVFLSVIFVTNITLLSIVLSSILVGTYTNLLFALTFFATNILYSIVLAPIFAIIILLVNKKPILPMWKGILFFGVFLTSWLPINLLVLFFNEIKWKEMKHNSKIKFKLLR